MAKKFNEINSGKLGLYDIIRSGKYIDCRVDSIVEQDPEYLIWMEKKKIFSYTAETIAAIAAILNFNESVTEYDDEVEQFLDDIPF